MTTFIVVVGVVGIIAILSIEDSLGKIYEELKRRNDFLENGNKEGV